MIRLTTSNYVNSYQGKNPIGYNAVVGTITKPPSISENRYMHY